MNGYDTDGDGGNNFYTVNGRSFYYARYPIRVRKELVRVYLANLTEFDLINSLHLHADFFRYQPTGTGEHWEYTDTDAVPGPARRAGDPLREHGHVHVPRAPVGVHRARLDGLLPGGGVGSAMEAPSAVGGSPGWRVWALVPVVLLAVAVAFVVSQGDRVVDLLGGSPPPADEFDVRRVESARARSGSRCGIRSGTT